MLFHLEQALQLCLKYKLYEKYGDFPKTHSLKQLLAELGAEVGIDPLVVDLLEDAWAALHPGEVLRGRRPWGASRSGVGAPRVLMSLGLYRRLWERRTEELRNLWATLERLKARARELDPGAQIYVLGSFARGAPAPTAMWMCW